MSSTAARRPHRWRGAGEPEREVIVLDRLTPERLQQEARRVGLRALEVRGVAPTEQHTASTVVILGA